MKALAMFCLLSFGMFSSKPANSAVFMYINGNEFISHGTCAMWDTWVDNTLAVVECTDLGFPTPPWDTPYPGSAPANIGYNGESHTITMMNGNEISILSKKAYKKIRKDGEKGKLSKKKLSKYLAIKGKADKKFLKQTAESYGLKLDQGKTKLRDQGKALEPSQTCIDEIYNSRRETWKKMGMAPLQILTGGLVGAGAAAGGTAIAVNTSARLPEVLLSLGMSSSSIVGTAATYGSVIGAVGIAGYVLVKEIYLGVKLARNAKMIRFIAQSRLPRRLGGKKGYDHYMAKALGIKNPDSEDLEYMSDQLIQLDQSGELCKDGKIMSYRKLRKEMKRRGRKYAKNLGNKGSMTCKIRVNRWECKARDNDKHSKCGASLGSLPQAGQSFFMSLGSQDGCKWSSNRPSGSATGVARINVGSNGEFELASAEMSAEATHFSVTVRDERKNKVMFIKSRQTPSVSGDGVDIAASTGTHRVHGEGIVHRDIAVRRKRPGRLKYSSVTLERSASIGDVDDDDWDYDEMIGLSVKVAKRPKNFTKCSAKMGSAGQEITLGSADGSCEIVERKSGDNGKSMREFKHEAKIMAGCGNHPNCTTFIGATTVGDVTAGVTSNVEANSCSMMSSGDGFNSRTCTYEGAEQTSECRLSSGIGSGGDESGLRVKLVGKR